MLLRCISAMCAQFWWIQSDSNRPHPACKAGALPDELWTHNSMLSVNSKSSFAFTGLLGYVCLQHTCIIWCCLWESNSRHPAYKAGALPTELRQQKLERDNRIELLLSVWKTEVLPLNESRNFIWRTWMGSNHRRGD